MSPERPASRWRAVARARRGTPGAGRGHVEAARGSRRAARPGWRRRRGRAASRYRASATVPPGPARAGEGYPRPRPEGGAEALVGPLVPVTASGPRRRPGRPAPLDPTVVGEAGVAPQARRRRSATSRSSQSAESEVEQRGSGEDVGRLVAEDLEVGPQVEAAEARGRAGELPPRPAAISAESISTKVQRCPAGSRGARQRRSSRCRRRGR